MAEHELKKRSIGRDGAVQTFVRRSLPIEQRLVQTQQSFRQMKQLGGGMAASGHGSIPAPPFRWPSEGQTGLLNLLVGKEPNQGFIGEVSNLNAVSPRIPKVATEIGMQLEFVLARELTPD